MVNIEAYIGYNDNGIKTLFVNAEFDEHYVPGQSISELAIATEEYYSDNYPDDDPRILFKKYQKITEKKLEVEAKIIDSIIPDEYKDALPYSDDVLDKGNVGNYVIKDNLIYKIVEATKDITRIQEQINLNEILVKGDNHLYIIYIKIDNTQALTTKAFSELECKDLKSYTITLAIDYTKHVEVALCLASKIDTCCTIPCDLMDEILKLSTMDLAIKLQDLDTAVKYFTLFFKTNTNNIKLKPCNCHG